MCAYVCARVCVCERDNLFQSLYERFYPGIYSTSIYLLSSPPFLWDSICTTCKLYPILCLLIAQDEFMLVLCVRCSEVYATGS